jgi:beta-ureidopropionase
LPRKVWVATTTLHGSATRTVEGNTGAAQILLEAACAQSPDIVCLPETFASADVQYTEAKQVAQRVPGPITEMVAEAARRHSTYVICPLLEERDGRVYNSAVLPDRRGQIAGVYEKIHPVTCCSDYT